MYASKRSINKAQGISNAYSKINAYRHKGMRKAHLQITPDGKVIQHYKMDSRSAAVMRSLKEAQKKAADQKEQKETVESENE